MTGSEVMNMGLPKARRAAMGRCRRLVDEETARMKAHCETPQELALIVFAERTGYRSSELASLKVGDIWDGTRLKTHVQVETRNMKKEVSRMALPLHPG
jgi:integrase